MEIIINRSDDTFDSVMTVSIAKMIKDKCSDAKIIMLASPQNADLFIHNEAIDDVYIYDRSQTFLLKLKKILFLFRKIKPTHYIYSGGGFSPNFIAWLLSVPYRGGLKAKWHTYLFLNKGIRQSRSIVSMHEMEYNLNLLTPMGLNYNYQDQLNYTAEILFTEKEDAKFKEKFSHELESFGFNPKLQRIVLHPGMDARALSWPSRNFARLINKFDKQFPNKFLYLITYNKEDADVIFELKNYIKTEISSDLQKNICFIDIGNKGLRHTMHILKDASLYVGANTGFTHVASALSIPVVGLFSPIKNQSVQRWKPLSVRPEKVKTIVPDVICGENHTCALKHCPYYECMSKIEIEDVYNKAMTILEIKSNE